MASDKTIALKQTKKIIEESKDFQLLKKRCAELSQKVDDKRFGSYDKNIKTIKDYNQACKKAQQEYLEIRSSTTDINSISSNTHIPKRVIERIKQHLFIREHKLLDGIRPFDRAYA